MLKRITVIMLAALTVIALFGLAGCSSGRKVSVTIPGGGTAVRGTDAPQVGASQRGGQGANGAGQIATIYFDYDNFFIRDDQMAPMNTNAQVVFSNSLRVRIEGHCDDRGTDEYNMALGQRRADQLRDFMVNYGVNAGSIETVSFGEMRPAVQGASDEASWSRNRRAETVITSGTIR